MEILAVVAILLVVVAGPVIVVNRDLLFNRGATRHSMEDEPLPFLLFPMSREPTDIIPAGVIRSQPVSSAPRATNVAGGDGDRGAATDARAAAPVEMPSIRAMETTPRWPRQIVDDADSDDPSADATIVFNRPVDEPVQILPGRLRVLSGDASGEDLRLFNRLGEPPRIVVGRETGPPHRHITLRSPTVSRRHARMEFIDGHWTITNLSATNPVLVNDRVLAHDGATRTLSDGDRIELGEVALRFLAS